MIPPGVRTLKGLCQALESMGADDNYVDEAVQLYWEIWLDEGMALVTRYEPVVILDRDWAIEHLGKHWAFTLFTGRNVIPLNAFCFEMEIHGAGNDYLDGIVQMAWDQVYRQ